MPLVVLLAAGEVWAQCSPLHPDLCDLPVVSTIEQPNLERAVDIVFVGDEPGIHSWVLRGSSSTDFGSIPTSVVEQLKRVELA